MSTEVGDDDCQLLAHVHDQSWRPSRRHHRRCYQQSSTVDEHTRLTTQSTRHKWAHSKAICHRGEFSPTKTVLNTDGLIITNEQTYGGVLKLMTNNEKKTERLEIKVKLLRKYLVWKKTKWIVMDWTYFFAVRIPNLKTVNDRLYTEV